MNFKELREVLEREIMRSDHAADYGDWVNQGLRSIYQNFSFWCMEFESRVTITSGSSSVSLPVDFKEFRKGRSPVCRVAGARLIPCDVTTREALVRLDAVSLSTVSYTDTSQRGFPVFITHDGSRVVLNTFDTLSEDTVFFLQYVRILPDLRADADENYITRTYEEMVRAKIKQVAFEAINDAVSADYELLYRRKRSEAVSDDAYRRVAGRRMQMGG
jgi:hypothetical protein